MYYIGIDVGGMSIKAGIINENGKILAKKSIVSEPEKDGDLIVKDIAQLIRDIASENGLSLSDINGIGMGFPGTVWDQKGEIVYCCNINLVKIPIVKILSKELGIKNIKISNDANCATYGETKFGAGIGAQNVVMITLGTGLGMGIIADGRMLTGNRSQGAEGGHMQINFSGATCGCGKKGHYEAYASATALIRQTKDAIDKNPNSILTEIAKKEGEITGKTAFVAYKQGDKVAEGVVKRYIKYIGIGLVNFANLFCPEKIIVGGGISKEGELLTKPLTRYVNRNYYGAKYGPHIEVVTATLGNDAGIIGAASLSM